MPDFFVGAWTVLLAPLGTPDPIIRKVNADMWTALDDPEVKTKYAANGGSCARCRRRRSAFVQDAAEDLAADPGAGGERSEEVDDDYLNSLAFASSAACSIVMNTAPSSASFATRSSSASMR